MAISGYNITILANIILWFCVFFLPRKKAFWIVLCILGLFVILTGAQASVVRAAIMGVLILYAHNQGRLSSPVNALALTAVIMVGISPMILRYDIGFQLSFMATIGLIYLGPIIDSYLYKIPNHWKLRETAVMTISAQIAVLPLILFYFGTLSLVSVPTNILILPIIPWAMLIGFITGLSGFILLILGKIIGYIAWLMSSVIIAIVHFMAGLTGAVIGVRFPWYLVVICYVIFIAFLWRYDRTRRKNI